MQASSSKGHERLWLRTLVALIAFAFVSLALLVGFVVYQKQAFAAKVRGIQVGDTKERIEELLGEPRQRFPKGGQISDTVRKQNLLLWLVVPESPETWVYGPLCLLALGPEKDDYAIEFDDTGRVTRVVFPHEP